jgi:hypothetical protein
MVVALLFMLLLVVALIVLCDAVGQAAGSGGGGVGVGGSCRPLVVVVSVVMVFGVSGRLGHTNHFSGCSSLNVVQSLRHH